MVGRDESSADFNVSFGKCKNIFTLYLFISRDLLIPKCIKILLKFENIEILFSLEILFFKVFSM